MNPLTFVADIEDFQQESFGFGTMQRMNEDFSCLKRPRRPSQFGNFLKIIPRAHILTGVKSGMDTVCGL